MSDRERYEAALHAMQSGVASTMGDECTPKHLRVGVNAAMADQGSLVRLLIAKGVLTEAEYLAAIADGMEAEKASYEKKLSEKFGANVRLG